MEDHSRASEGITRYVACDIELYGGVMYMEFRWMPSTKVKSKSVFRAVSSLKLYGDHSQVSCFFCTVY